MIIQLSFGKSSSCNYVKVLNLCKKIGKFEVGKFNVLTLEPADIMNKWDYFNSIFHLIKHWLSFELIIDGKSIFEYKTKSDFFYAIQEIKYCYHNYESTPDKEEYCKCNWGC